MVKIGIRPTIDGREKGIRESLEEQTMRMAKSAAKLISENVYDEEGNPVGCVIADTTIGGFAEAAKCQEKFDREGVCATLTVTPCWCYGSETMDMDPKTPKAIWGLNATERPGAVYLAAVLAAHAQKGIPAFSIYGHDVQDADDDAITDDVAEKILRFARAAVAVGEMKGKSYLSVGNVAMGIAGSMVNPDFFEEYLGMRCEYKDMSEIIRRVENEIYDKEEFERALVWTRENCKENDDLYNGENGHSREKKDAEWEYCVKMAMIVRDMMQGNEKLKEIGWNEEGNGNNAIAAGFQGQRQWTDFMPNGDFMESMLCSSFDWNGIRKPLVVATENDCLNGVAMLLGHLVTNTAAVFSDVRTYWSPEAVKRVTGKELTGYAQNGIIHLINWGAAALDASGEQEKDGKPAMKPFWEITEGEAQKCLDATKWTPGNLGYFRGGGFSSTFKTRGGMPVTMCRMNLVKGLGPVLQIAEGYTVELPDDMNKILWDRTDPGWPCTWFAPVLTGEGAFTDVYSVMANWGANHGASVYGHVGADLITLASMLRIPVNMHNVSEEKLFRPAAWNAFGTQDRESADYRACRNYGPLYK
ncbi:L-fucose isomerase [Christensenella minuta]|uniref:L-fucose isomerase n=1 Tax=Christensenella minuta TaxID=626937 RepID=UPI000EAD7FDE|nr:L-fucose isomerase [Christensenella minuta]AYH40302.1 L-fucose isomerase [Christensenella minuta]